MARSILLLGVPRVERDQHAISIERRKALGLLTYLAVTKQTHSRETLAALFWADYDHARAHAYLRNTLWTLNKALGDDWAVIDNDTVSFNDSSIEVDVNHFLSLTQIGEAPQNPINHKSASSQLIQAISLYRGDFLTGFSLRDCPEFEDWQIVQTENLRRHLANALERLIEYLIALGDFETAKTYARRWLSLDSLHEPAHRQLMRLYAWTGQYSAALRQYKEVEKILADELVVEPERETQDLYAQIQARQLATPKAKAEVEATPLPTQNPENAPSINTPFIGRETELADIQRLLADPNCRLLTLIGPGGIGKTRLATQAAQKSPLRDGSFVVFLTPVWSSEFIIPTIATSIKANLLTQDDQKTQLLKQLRNQELLLVLDNFEHLLSNAELLSEIIAAAPKVKILVTSRERLNLHEEWIYEIKGLSYPEQLTGMSLEGYSAVDLFVKSARRTRSDFKVSDENAAAIVRICQVVDGMPLAIELAATWIQILSCEEIAQEIQKGLDILTTEVRNIPERHRSLRAIFEQTWERLSADEQICLSRLSVLRGGFRQEAAQVVGGASLPLLLSLTSKSLLQRSTSNRFEIHELLRQYAEQKLTSEDLEATANRHCQYFLGFLRRHEAALKDYRQPEAIREVEQEIDNIRSAWYHAVAHGKIPWMQDSIEALFAYYLSLTKFQECLEIILKAVEKLNAETENEQLLLGKLTAILAWGYGMSGNVRQMQECATRGVELLHRFPKDAATAPWLMLIGDVRSAPGLPEEEASVLIHEALEIYQRYEDKWGVALGYYELGQLAHVNIRHDEARQYLETSFGLFKEIGQPLGLVIVQGSLARVAYTLGDYVTAREYLQEMLRLAELLGNQRLIMQIKGTDILYSHFHDDTAHVAMLQDTLKFYKEQGEMGQATWTLYELATISLFNGQYDEAARIYAECLPLFRVIFDFQGVCWTLIWQATIALERKALDKAEQLISESQKVIEGMNFPWGVSGAHYVLGDIALERGEFEQAKEHFLEAVRSAYEVQSMVQILRHLSGYAAWLIAIGELEKAAALTIYLYEHPSAWVDTRRRCARLVESLAKTLTIEQIEIIRNKSKQYTIESVMSDLLLNVSS